VARAARIASMNVTQPFPPLHSCVLTTFDLIFLRRQSGTPLPIPRNWHEFEKIWKTLRRSPDRFDPYISALPLQSWTAIFGSMMTGACLLLMCPQHGQTFACIFTPPPAPLPPSLPPHSRSACLNPKPSA